VGEVKISVGIRLSIGGEELGYHSDAAAMMPYLNDSKSLCDGMV